MINAINEYFDLLIFFFKYDISVYSKPWLYYWVLVPAIVYTIFFFIKWAILTTPLWLPFKLILGGLVRINKTVNNGDGKKSEKSEK